MCPQSRVPLRILLRVHLLALRLDRLLYVPPKRLEQASNVRLAFRGDSESLDCHSLFSVVRTTIPVPA
jgi:hypothetical protein